MSFDRFWLRQLFSSADRISWKETKIASHDEMQLLEKLKKMGGGGMKRGCILSRLIQIIKKYIYFAGARDFHQSADTDGERKTLLTIFLNWLHKQTSTRRRLALTYSTSPVQAGGWRGERGRDGGRSQYNETLL